MTVNKTQLTQEEEEEQKEIENGILKAIAEISDEVDWSENMDANNVQLIIAQLARSAAHLRECTTSKVKDNSVKKYPAK